MAGLHMEVSQLGQSLMGNAILHHFDMPAFADNLARLLFKIYHMRVWTTQHEYARRELEALYYNVPQRVWEAPTAFQCSCLDIVARFSKFSCLYTLMWRAGYYPQRPAVVELAAALKNGNHMSAYALHIEPYLNSDDLADRMMESDEVGNTVLWYCLAGAEYTPVEDIQKSTRRLVLQLRARGQLERIAAAGSVVCQDSVRRLLSVLY